MEQKNLAHALLGLVADNRVPDSCAEILTRAAEQLLEVANQSVSDCQVAQRVIAGKKITSSGSELYDVLCQVVIILDDDGYWNERCGKAREFCMDKMVAILDAADHAAASSSLPRRTAPVQAPYGHIPWEVHLLAAQTYNRFGHNQSAERLAARGGFSWGELIACFRGDYSPAGCAKADDELKAILNTTSKVD